MSANGDNEQKGSTEFRVGANFPGDLQLDINTDTTQFRAVTFRIFGTIFLMARNRLFRVCSAGGIHRKAAEGDEYRGPAGQRAVWRFTSVGRGPTHHKYSSYLPLEPNEAPMYDEYL